MIVVQLPDATTEEFDSATRFNTDEHNNLCIWGGRKTDALLAVFNAAAWVQAGVVDDDHG
jgi:hypothetical protein